MFPFAKVRHFSETAKHL